MRRVLNRLAIVVLGLAIGIVLAEAAIRLGGLDRPWVLLSLLRSAEPTSTYHPLLGWMNLPDSKAVLRWADSKSVVPLPTNAQGFRFPRDFTVQRQRRYRMAIVGDSQVFGFVVGDDEHLAVVLERAMPDVETYPFGVPGYGPTQEMLLLDEEVFRYAPDLVVAVLFLENDLNDETQSFGYGWLARPYLSQASTGWEVANVPVPLQVPGPEGQRRFLRPNGPAFRWSSIYRVLAYRAQTFPVLAQGLTLASLGEIETMRDPRGPDPHRSRGFGRIDGAEPVCTTATLCPKERWLDGLPATRAAYKRMQSMSREHGARFVAVVAPAAVEVRRGDYTMTTAVLDAFREDGIEAIAVAPAFSADGDPARFIASDLHWTAGGTQRVARLVGDWARGVLEPGS